MVQYVFTPWKDRRELLEVCRQFYPLPAATPTSSIAEHHPSRNAAAAAAAAASVHSRGERQTAVSRVSMWMQRGGCPHMVESTAMLVAATLADEASRGADGSNSSYAVRAAYSAAFGRFVTGLLDSHQDKSHKMSMYSIAKTIGLPATFVELRHQATHEQLPSLARLRAGASAGLAWIWDYYWKHLASPAEDEGAATAEEDRGTWGTGPGGDESVQDAACRAVLMRHLEGGGGDDGSSSDLRKLVGRWGAVRVLRTLDVIGDEAASSLPMDNGLVLGTVRLSRQVAALRPSQPGRRHDEPRAEEAGGNGQPVLVKDPAALRSDLEESRRQLAEMEARKGENEQKLAASEKSSGSDNGSAGGWSQHQGPWRSKPIGVV